MYVCKNLLSQVVCIRLCVFPPWAHPPMPLPSSPFTELPPGPLHLHRVFTAFSWKAWGQDQEGLVGEVNEIIQTLSMEGNGAGDEVGKLLGISWTVRVCYSQAGAREGTWNTAQKGPQEVSCAASTRGEQPEPSLENLQGWRCYLSKWPLPALHCPAHKKAFPGVLHNPSRPLCECCIFLCCLLS